MPSLKSATVCDVSLVALTSTDVSEESITSIIKVIIIGELGTK
jgi:hypothetical protein